MHTTFPMSHISAAIRVLDIPEILDHIFNLSHASDIARSALTCRNWCDIALDHLWEKSPSLLKLLRILGPIERVEWNLENNVPGHYPGPQWTFGDHVLTSDDWERFMTYSRRIKEISLMDEDLQFSTRAFVAIARRSGRTLDTLLPNLKGLVFEVYAEFWRVHVEEVEFFMNERLMSICLKTMEWSEELRTLLKEIPIRSPKITAFSYDAYLADEEAKDGLTTLLPKLRCLKTLYVSPKLLSAEAMEVVSALPNLQKFDGMGETISETINRNEEEYSIQMPMEQVGAGFPELRVLLLENSLSDVTHFFRHFFRHGNSFANLRKISIEISDSTTAKVQACLESISSACSRVQKIKIFQNRHSFAMVGSAWSKDVEPIRAETLSLLPSFQHLMAFKLRVVQHLDIKDDELVHILVGCKNLQTLCLNCNPRPDLNTAPTIAVLSLLAQKKLALKKLSLLVDAGMRAFPRVTGTFQSLESIDFGCSSVRMSTELVLYLSKVLPESCRIRWETEEAICSRCVYYQSQEDAQFGTSRETWRRIADRVPFLRQMLLKERASLTDKRTRTDAQNQT
ncbi:hypothetical protein M0805_008802 [Coniferiporia weirii]|nr:hypothetical protein M0805_008802 [Coniferiporia weirii]